MKILYILGFLWSLPLSIPMWIFTLFLYVTKQIEKFKVYPNLVFMIDLTNDGWFLKKAFEDRGWVGFSFGNSIIVKDSNTERWERTIKHETIHSYQCYKGGIFQPILYLLECLRILLLVPDKHSYYDNRFEIEARRYAGQPIVIPKSQWAEGPKDRWLFW